MASTFYKPLTAFSFSLAERGGLIAGKVPWQRLAGGRVTPARMADEIPAPAS